MKKWFHDLLTQNRRPAQNTKAPRASMFRKWKPLFERLEDRVTPVVFNFSNPGAIVNSASIVDQRLSDFLVLTALNGGNGQPRAVQFSVRFGF